MSNVDRVRDLLDGIKRRIGVALSDRDANSAKLMDSIRGMQRFVLEWERRAVVPADAVTVPAQPSDETIERMCAALTDGGWPDSFGQSAQRIRRDRARAAYAVAIAGRKA